MTAHSGKHWPRIDTTWSRPTWWNLVAGLPWAIGAVASIYLSFADGEIAARERAATAILVSHDPGNHDSFGYVFYVNGRKYIGEDSPAIDGMKIGQNVTIYYDAKHPSKSSLTDFEDRYLNDVGPVPALFFGIGAIGLFMCAIRRKNRAGGLPA